MKSTGQKSEPCVVRLNCRPSQIDARTRLSAHNAGGVDGFGYMDLLD